MLRPTTFCSYSGLRRCSSSSSCPRSSMAELLNLVHKTTTGLGPDSLLPHDVPPDFHLFANRQSTPIGTTVSLDYGTFVGFRNDTNGITYFQGIRYADPPIGELRWRAPVSPPTSHLGIVNATEFAAACIRTVQVTVAATTSEDCLFGNVYVPPNTQTDDRLPVLVWFHGGGYQTGNTCDAPPDFIMNSSAKPFVFASFEYRLGQFGFLGGSQIKEDGDLNAGFLDQRAALRWVQRYIHLFGGDRMRVTIWGQSAGAGSTMFHLLANNGNNEGLFRAAIGDSPPLTFVPAYNETYVEGVFTQFASFTDCANQGASTLQCLRSQNITSSMLARAGNRTITARPSTLYVFAPILDYTTIPVRPVEGFSPANQNTTTFARVPVLFGSNTNDGANWSSTRIRDPAANTSAPGADEQTLFRFLQGQYASLKEETVQEAVAADGNLYPLSNYDSLTLQAQQMYGEMRFICSAGMIVGAMSESAIVDAYQYHYDNPNLGSDHHDELTAFFSPPPPNASPGDLALFGAMREYWTSFVTDGKPTSRSGVEWTPARDGAGSPRILLHPGAIEMEEVEENLRERCAFWRRVSGEMQT